MNVLSRIFSKLWTNPKILFHFPLYIGNKPGLENISENRFFLLIKRIDFEKKFFGFFAFNVFF